MDYKVEYFSIESGVEVDPDGKVVTRDVTVELANILNDQYALGFKFITSVPFDEDTVLLVFFRNDVLDEFGNMI